MMRLLTFVFAAALTFGVAAPVSAGPNLTGPESQRGTVVLTYDDALPSQITTVLPALDAAGLHGVFFLSGIKAADIATWRAAAAEGHELANHTIFHPCLAATFPADPHYQLENYTPQTMVNEIVQANVLLTAIDGRTRHGFATPCGATTAGGQDYLEPLRQAGIVDYTRGVSVSAEDLTRDIRDIDRMHVAARGFDEKSTGADLIAFAQEAERGGGLAVFLFHGVGADHLAISTAAHAELLAWLLANRQTVWTTTLTEAFARADANPKTP